MDPQVTDTVEMRLRHRIRQLEKTLTAYDHAVNTPVIDRHRKTIAALASALVDAVSAGAGGAPVEALVKRGLSTERAREIVSFVHQKVS